MIAYLHLLGGIVIGIILTAIVGYIADGYTREIRK